MYNPKLVRTAEINGRVKKYIPLFIFEELKIDVKDRIIDQLKRIPYTEFLKDPDEAYFYVPDEYAELYFRFMQKYAKSHKMGVQMAILTFPYTIAFNRLFRKKIAEAFEANEILVYENGDIFDYRDLKAAHACNITIADPNFLFNEYGIDVFNK